MNSENLVSNTHGHFTGFFPWRLTSGGFLTVGYCFPVVFWKFLWGDETVMEGDKVVIRGIPHQGKLCFIIREVS